MRGGLCHRIVEGFAEYYSLELLLRGGAITARRHARALGEQAEWAKRADMLCGDVSTGATTARAVTLLRDLDREIRERTAGARKLDDLLHELLLRGVPVNTDVMAGVGSSLIGGPSDVLHIDNLPGCPRITPQP